MSKITQNINLVDLPKYNTVFCDSMQALDWAYDNGLSRSAIIKSSSPAMLWDNNKNVRNIEARWTVDELEKFQSTIQKLTDDVFDVISNVIKVERELALTVSLSVHQFQRIIYKAACLDADDFTSPRLFIYTDGKTGPAGNMMNSIWDQLLVHNPLFSIATYTLKNDEWKMLNTRSVSYWRRYKVAGYETIIYRLAIKLSKMLPNWIFTKEILIPNENELNIEIASSLALHGVKVSKIQLGSSPNTYNKVSGENTKHLYNAVLPIVRKRIKEWVTPDAVEVTLSLFKSHLEGQLKKFTSLTYEWESVIPNNASMRRAVLINSPGNIKGYALAYVCRKNHIPLLSSQHGVTVEISRAHSMANIGFDNSVADAMFSYNAKIVEIEKNTRFNNSKHYIVGMPMRHIRMKFLKINDKLAPPIVYISTNMYHMGLCLSSETDYDRSRNEQDIVSLVLSKLPQKVRYKAYPEDNRRYSDIDPVLSYVKKYDNIELFDEKIDMRYLISDHSILVTTCATSTLGWPIMSRKPVVFINQNNNNPLTDEAFVDFSKGIFVFDNKKKNFHQELRRFLSQSIEEIEILWQDKKSAREYMLRKYFNAYVFGTGTSTGTGTGTGTGAGARASKIIIKEYLKR